MTESKETNNSWNNMWKVDNNTNNELPFGVSFKQTSQNNQPKTIKSSQNNQPKTIEYDQAAMQKMINKDIFGKDNINGLMDRNGYLQSDVEIKGNSFASKHAYDSKLDFILPQYGVADFINERALWQKGVHNISGEPGWFYFKIFFNFKDQKGLFGGIMTDEIPTTSAIRYLYGIREFYKQSKIKDRILALTRFTYTLSFINSVSPWFFIGINNANKLNSLDLKELTKEKYIDIICNGESIDMRLNTLLDMYRYACYDEINQKEIIPENLRKFDMSIVIMNAPIKYFQTAIMTSDKLNKMGQVGHNSTILNKVISGINKIAGMVAGSSTNMFDFKNINGDNNNIDNMLSFQMYTLKNCEIDPISFESYVPSNLNNSQFNKQGLGYIKVKYDRCYKHTFNEWSQMFYGTTGILYDMNTDELIKNHQNLVSAALSGQTYNTKFNSNTNNQRIAAIQQSIYNSFFDKDTEAYKGLIDFSEAVIQDSLINVKDPNYLGNIAENYDQTNWEDRWYKAKNKVTHFFKNPLDIF